MHLFRIPRCAFRFSRPLTSRRMHQSLQEGASAFQQELKTIDPKVLATSMGGAVRPPEEPLLSGFEDGFGYINSIAVKRWLKQYFIVRKLGWASSSSVWLALDNSAETRTFVAMKILTSQATARIVTDHSPEYEVFRKIEYTNPNSPGFNHCLTLRHCFIVNSEAGGHICFVTDPLSSSLADLRVPGQNPFTLPIAKRITKQVLLALDYLHRECGYIHTDIKSDNILVSIPQPAASRIEEYIQGDDACIYGPPLDLKSLPLPLVFSCSQPLPYLSLCESLDDVSVRLTDYSEATPVEGPVRGHLLQPGVLRAPEVTLGYPWTSAIDIWTVGCLLYELLTQRQLFNQPGKYSHKLHLQYIVECLGPFPLEFLKDCKDRGKYLDEEGGLLYTNSEFAPTTVEDELRKLNVMNENEIPGAAAFLRRCWTLDPRLRPSAQELLKDSWLL